MDQRFAYINLVILSFVVILFTSLRRFTAMLPHSAWLTSVRLCETVGMLAGWVLLCSRGARGMMATGALVLQ